MTCEIIGEWVRNRGPEPSELSEHLATCVKCRALVDDVTEVRGWFVEDEGGAPVLDTETQASIRFQLQAAARGAPTPRTAPDPRRRSRAVLATAVAMGLAAAFALALWPESASRIEPERGAVYERSRDERGERIHLQRGAATFEVDPVGRSEHFTVWAGPDEVRVRGTRFRVVVEGERIERVTVDEGRVEVFSRGTRVADLRAGQEWQAPKPVVSESEDSPRVPATPELIGPDPASEETVARGEPAIDRNDDAPFRVRRTRSRPEPTTDVEMSAIPSLDETFDEGWRAHVAGDAPVARRTFRSLLGRSDLGERRADILFWLAQSELQLGDMDAAIRHLEELTAGHPSFLRTREAQAQLRRLRRTAPSNQLADDEDSAASSVTTRSADSRAPSM